MLQQAASLTVRNTKLDIACTGMHVFVIVVYMLSGTVIGQALGRYLGCVNALNMASKETRSTQASQELLPAHRHEESGCAPLVSSRGAAAGRSRGSRSKATIQLVCAWTE